MLELASNRYPPIADYTVWLSDIRRADMSPEQLAGQHLRDRETYRRMRERMAADPTYREARLAVSRGTSRRWRERSGDRLDVKLLRLNRDRARWALKGPELKARRRERYVGETAERIRAANRDWYDRNREKRKEYRKRYRQEHLEEVRALERESRRRTYAADPRAHLDYLKAWRAQNLERARGYVRAAGNKRRSAFGSFSVDEWFALLEAHDGRCAYCGSTERIEADHRVPLCRGGSNTIDNVVPACIHCNRRKQRKTEAEFRALLAREARELRRGRRRG